METIVNLIHKLGESEDLNWKRNGSDMEMSGTIEEEKVKVSLMPEITYEIWDYPTYAVGLTVIIRVDDMKVHNVDAGELSGSEEEKIIKAFFDIHEKAMKDQVKKDRKKTEAQREKWNQIQATLKAAN